MRERKEGKIIRDITVALWSCAITLAITVTLILMLILTCTLVRARTCILVHVTRQQLMA